MEKFAKLERSEDLSKKLAAKLKAASEKAAKDPNFKTNLETDPEPVLRELGFDGEGVRTFRLLDDVQTKESCSCSCFPVVSGTGVGCQPGTQGSSSSSH